MHRDLVENKGWLTEEEYKEGLALAQLAPGTACGRNWVHIFGLCTLQVIGANTCRPGFCAAIVYYGGLLGMAYQLYGGLAWLQAVFYGVGAAVIGIIAMSSYIS